MVDTRFLFSQLTYLVLRGKTGMLGKLGSRLCSLASWGSCGMFLPAFELFEEVWLRFTESLPRRLFFLRAD